MCVCVCMHVYICKYIKYVKYIIILYLCLRVLVSVRAGVCSMFICLCISACELVNVHVYVHELVYVHFHLYARVYVLNVHVFMYICIYMHANIIYFIHKNAYVCTYLGLRVYLRVYSISNLFHSLFYAFVYIKKNSHYYICFCRLYLLVNA